MNTNLMAIYSTSHLLQLGLLPPGINLLLIIAGIAIGIYWQRTGRFILLLGILSLWLLSAPIVAYQILGLLQNQYPVVNADTLNVNPSHEAIVILGGGDTTSVEYGNKQTVSNFTLHRINYAAYLHEKTHLPIIVSGGKNPGAAESIAQLMANVLKENFNITPAFLEDKSMSTADESQLLAPVLKEKGFKSIYLVTDAWHMPRSVFIFQCAGIKVIPAPMGHFVYGPGYALISYLPNINALYASSLAMHEGIGLLWYHLQYSSQCHALEAASTSTG